MDGLEATRRIRECKELCRSAPVLAFTAFDTYGMEQAAIEAGANGYIRKRAPTSLLYLHESDEHTPAGEIHL